MDRIGDPDMIRVLLVDDEPFVRRGLIETIPWDAFNMTVVEQASNGFAAMEIANRENIDLMFVDLEMPGMTGLELIQQLKNKHSDLNYVVLTCHQDFAYAQKAMRAGVLDYIVKTQMTGDNISDIFHHILNRYNEQRSSRKLYLSESSEIDLRMMWMDGTWIFQESNLINDCLDSIIKQRWFKEFRLLKNLIFGTDENCLSWEEWINKMQSQFRGVSRTNTISEDICLCVWKALLYIMQTYNQDITQEKIASQFAINRSYFSKVFSILLQTSFNRFLRNLRISHAQELILMHQQPIYWIAEKVGYRDIKYFSRIFKEYTGHLPKNYRCLFM